MQTTQGRRERKKEMVEAQNARMCGFCWTVPHTRSKGSSVALLFSSTANLKSDMADAQEVKRDSECEKP